MLTCANAVHEANRLRDNNQKRFFSDLNLVMRRKSDGKIMVFVPNRQIGSIKRFQKPTSVGRVFSFEYPVQSIMRVILPLSVDRKVYFDKLVVFAPRFKQLLDFHGCGIRHVAIVRKIHQRFPVLIV